MQNVKPRAALLASPGMGHVIPAVELSHRLAALHGFHVTVFVLEADPESAQSRFLSSSSPAATDLDVHVITLPPPEITVNPSAHVVVKIAAMMRESVPAVRSKIAAMPNKPTALIVDLFGTEALRLADEFNMLKYVLIASNARFLAVVLYFPTLDEAVEKEHVNRKKPLAIPGCEPVRFEDNLDAYQDRTDPLYHEFMRIGKAFATTDGILVNTWEEMEPKTLKSLQDPNLLGRVARAPVYPIGPLNRPVETAKTVRSPVLEWLDKQPAESVLYISFGSGGSLTAKQLIELAYGLELSQQRFLWVVRPPVDGSASAEYFTANTGGGNGGDGTPGYLPQGFVARTRNLGLVVPSWAPQAEVLAHVAVGGFLTHCGWNSTLESIVNGIPMITWPLFAEQRMNARLLKEEIGVAVGSEEPSDGCDCFFVSRNEIEGMARKIMAGEEENEMRKKVMMLRNSAENSLSRRDSLSKLAKECEIHLERVMDMQRGG
ncbi:PREDICTED: UDP-glycosyltransferase 72E2-like [Tarenaya hassleriana]|uniref:UDP-glycosyltransferase 72E2-like n=1 Tax=Tarenaya hassleriana TaxID=28532 RepID=UPI00053C2B0B|nr:PREDICTED: UDP-glycosyltransferase 72E2-like [Tarenaya hassleriana]